MRTKTLIWAPQDGTTRLVDNDPTRVHVLLEDADAGNGQKYSFDAFDQIMAIGDNNANAPEEHTCNMTDADVWRRFTEWAMHSDTSYMVIQATANDRFIRKGGNMALKELWGVRYE